MGLGFFGWVDEDFACDLCCGCVSLGGILEKGGRGW